VAAGDDGKGGVLDTGGEREERERLIMAEMISLAHSSGER